jgi:hypothetical protein
VDSEEASGMAVVTILGLDSGVVVGMACVDVDVIVRYGGHSDSVLGVSVV